MKHRLLLRMIALLFTTGAICPQAFSAQHDAALHIAAEDLHHRYLLRHDQRDRHYEVVLPGPGRATHLPVIMAIHGATGSLETYRKVANLEALARREGILVVYPEGTRVGNVLLWNASACCLLGPRPPDDVDFLLHVLDDIERRFAVDPRRVYAVGMSNGAMMTYRLATEAPERFAAVATVAGPMALRHFEPRAPISIMHIQSVDDPILPFAGRRMPPLPLPSGEKTLRRWLDYAHCPAEPVSETVRHASRGEPAAWQATRTRWAPCDAETEIILWKLAGAGHVWPGGYQPAHLRAFAGGEFDVIDASREIWQFFQRHRLPATEEAT